MPSRAPNSCSSRGVRRDALPLPPATYNPRSRARGASPSLSAPQTVVVTPLECQSNPSTHPKAWNQNGSDNRCKKAERPCSRTIASAISGASFAMRSKSHRGALPPCSGRVALPTRCGICARKLVGLSDHLQRFARDAPARERFVQLPSDSLELLAEPGRFVDAAGSGIELRVLE